MADPKRVNPSETDSATVRVTSTAIAVRDEEPVASEQLADEVLLLPWGWVRSSKGEFLVDEEGAQAVLEAFRKQGTDLVIDYEHQSLGGRYSSPSGLAPAAGWISDLRIREGEGIWGTVRWTPTAAARILRREYRYLSPVVIVRKEDRRVIGLDSVGLTNRPAIPAMPPVIHSRDISAPNRAGPQAQEAGKMEDALKPLRNLLSLEEGASTEEVVGVACKRLTELIGQAQRREAEEKVAKGMQAGKIAESQKRWAITYAMQDPEGFEQWLHEAPVVVCMDRIVGEEDEPTGTTAGRRRAVIAAARSEWQANGLLQQLTSERAYVNEALQGAGLDLLCGDERL